MADSNDEALLDDTVAKQTQKEGKKEGSGVKKKKKTKKKKKIKKEKNLGDKDSLANQEQYESGSNIESPSNSPSVSLIIHNSLNIPETSSKTVSPTTSTPELITPDSSSDIQINGSWKKDREKKKGSNIEKDKEKVKDKKEKPISNTINPTIPKPLKTCSLCKKSIKTEFIEVSEGNFVHPECLICALCNSLIDTSDIYEEDGKYYCRACEDKIMCTGCGFPLEDNYVRLPGDLSYHPDCLKCTECRVLLGSDGLLTYHDYPYCSKCYDLISHVTSTRDLHKEDIEVEYCTFCTKPLVHETDTIIQCRLKAGLQKWHIECFRCSLCLTQETDPSNSTFSEVDGKLACKDCSELCGSCGEAVGKQQGEGGWKKQAGRSWHTVCLKCSTCLTPLYTGEKIYDWEGNIKCSNCYQRHQIEDACARCGKSLGLDPYVNALGRNWHRDCFRCKTCNRSVRGSFMKLNGEPYCDDCYHEEERRANQELVTQPTSARGLAQGRPEPKDEEVCSKCGKNFDGVKRMSALGKKWHLDCFQCHICGKHPLQEFYTRDDNPYCDPCYRASRKKPETPPVSPHPNPPSNVPSSIPSHPSPRTSEEICASCSKPISGKRVLALAKKYHENCFVCQACGKGLENGFLEKEGRIHCGCLDEIPCGRCSKPLLLSQKRITAMGKKWHTSCFVCCGCDGDVVESGFYPGKDNLPFCLACYRAAKNT